MWTGLVEEVRPAWALVWLLPEVACQQALPAVEGLLLAVEGVLLAVEGVLLPVLWGLVAVLPVQWQTQLRAASAGVSCCAQ